MIDRLETALWELNVWRKANIDKIGTPEFRETTIAHRRITDLLAGYGTPEQRAAVQEWLSASQRPIQG